MSEREIKKPLLTINFLIGLIMGGMMVYIVIPSKQTVVEVPVSRPGDPVTVEKLQEKISGLESLIYGAIGASLISALAAIISLMQISRRLPNSFFLNHDSQRLGGAARAVEAHYCLISLPLTMLPMVLRRKYPYWLNISSSRVKGV